MDWIEHLTGWNLDMSTGALEAAILVVGAWLLVVAARRLFEPRYYAADLPPPWVIGAMLKHAGLNSRGRAAWARVMKIMTEGVFRDPPLSSAEREQHLDTVQAALDELGDEDQRQRIVWAMSELQKLMEMHHRGRMNR